MTDWADYICDFSSQDIGNQALAIHQSTRGDHQTCEALLDRFFLGIEYTNQLDAVRNAMCEGATMSSEGYEFDIGHLTYGIRANAADLCDAYWKQPARRVEFGEQEIRDIREAVLGLWTVLREIEKQEAA